MNGESSVVKVERGMTPAGAAEPRIKPDPDSAGGSPATFEDDDIYEDAGDLDFTNSNNPVWLMRIPKILWENWTNIDDDEEIQLGTVRLEGSHDNMKRLSLLLSPDVPQNRDVPKEYNLRITNQNPVNTYVFTEKDLPGYASKVGRSRLGPDQGSKFPPIPSRLQYEGRGPNRNHSQNKPERKRWEPYYRKAIPKQTAMSGQVQHELNCIPVVNEEYQKIMDEWTLQKTKPKRETKFLGGHVGTHTGNLLPSGRGRDGDFGGFIKTTGPPRGKPQEQKAARIPQNELLDLIYGCFQRYQYWSMRSLRAELKQPEAYLKSTLEKVAHLVRQGNFAMHWTLKPEARESTYANAASYSNVKNEAAPDSEPAIEGSDVDEGDGMGGGDDDDEENVKMEDVMPS
ncbi:MAG: hypothetical protein M1819_004618 [Sarea resinae]|nr:MAG: hypothetical protein M1819_004618 [Sarea resinae]